MNDKFYNECANILENIYKTKTSLKTEVYKKKNPTRYLAILSQIVANKNEYEDILQKLNFKVKNKYKSLIYIHEVINNKMKLKNSLTIMIQSLGKNIKRQDVQKTTYFRMNTHTTTVFPSFDFSDTSIPGVFKTKEKIFDTTWYNECKVLIQNLSSCLPIYLLNPEENSKIIDACAAPGNKTTQISMHMKNSGMIYAYEKNYDRFQTLKNTIKKYSCTNIDAYNMDFLDTDVMTEVDYIILDPSCTGSGIHDIYEKDEERLSKIQLFQKKMLLHAMQFRSAKKIVYSTCSIHEEENEWVVQEVLKEQKLFKLERINIEGMDFVERGDTSFGFSDHVARVVRDKTNNLNGFFVAIFVRNKS